MSRPRAGDSLASWEPRQALEGLRGQLLLGLGTPEESPRHHEVSREGPPPSSGLSPSPASKGNGLGTICLWSWSQTWAARGKQSSLPVVVLARLQWSPTRLAYFSLSTCPGEPPHPCPRTPRGCAPRAAPLLT